MGFDHRWYHGQSWLHCALSYMVSLPVKVALDKVNKGRCLDVACKFNSSSSYFKTIIAR